MLAGSSRVRPDCVCRAGAEVIRDTRDVGAAARAGYDAILDVRAPSEFAEDHLPGAINLPVLDDAERAEVGEEYVQRSKFLARRRGAAMVARNIARHLETALADRDGSFRPLVYCWRGGQQSGAMVTVMDQVGWPVTRLDGGYQTWRRAVVTRLYEPAADAPPLRVVVLDGLTGVGKTEVLTRSGALGAQVLDLEGLAGHRGSVFGATEDGQPSQKLFDSRLAVALDALDPARPILVEAESSRIGRVTVPPRLWASMKAAPRLTLTATTPMRIARLMSDYADLAADVEALDALLARMPRHHGKERRQAWREMGAEGRVADLVESLLNEHYDPAYARSAPPRRAVGEVTLEGVTEAEAERAAARVAETLARLEAGQDRGWAAE